MGRPSTFTPEIAAKICERLAAGESLAAASTAEGVPRSTVRQWIEDDTQGFAADSARAFAAGYDALADQCLQIADTPCLGFEKTTKADGSEEVKEGDMLGHRRLQIDTRMRLLGKWAPKKYGDRQELHHTADESLAATILAARQRSGG